MPLEGSDYVPADSTSHILKLLGKDVWGGKVAVSVRLALTGGKVVAKLETRCETDNLSPFVIASAE
jgi:coatomer protein complex subunit gamma